MIRKMLIIAAAVAMPATVVAGATTSSVAGAAKLPPAVGSCAITGSVVFASPGITDGGTITKLKSSTSVSTTTPASGSICGTKPVAAKITTATSACWTTLPVYSKTAPVGGVLATGAPAGCDIGGGAAASDAVVSATDVKAALKTPDYYGTKAGFISGGATSIVPSLNAHPLKLSNNGNNTVLTATSASSVLPGGVCGGVAGFQINGTTTLSGAGHVTIDVCLSGDTGTATTNVFVTDLLTPGTTILSGTIGGLSNITYSA